ncbi:MAG: DUF2867 domain-containing protein [Vampirovibrionales bacterium]|nr:DUF2867 domain-containing protein [Vampirovibrionales bacterium]
MMVDVSSQLWMTPSFTAPASGKRDVSVAELSYAGANAGSLGARNQLYSDTLIVDALPGVSAPAYVFSMIQNTPAWMRALFKLHHVISRPLTGSASSTAQILSGSSLAAGDALGPFPVLAVSQHGVLSGSDEQHLQFRSFYRLQQGLDGKDKIACTTLVRFKDTVGRAYFSLIRPFHQLFLSTIMKRATYALGHAEKR